MVGHMRNQVSGLFQPARTDSVMLPSGSCKQNCSGRSRTDTDGLRLDEFNAWLVGDFCLPYLLRARRPQAAVVLTFPKSEPRMDSQS